MDFTLMPRHLSQTALQGAEAPLQLLPELLTSNDGSTVTAANWSARRQELAGAIIAHQFGELPPRGRATTLIRRCISSPRHLSGVTYYVYDVTVEFDASRQLTFTLSLWVPPGDGPFPVVLDGDGCWRYFSEERVVREILARGNIAASIDRTQAAADNPDDYRKSGLYRLFPDATYGALAAWAWACHRAIDALLQLPQVRGDAIALTGHSRGGKTVLLAGATDERIALTNPNCSGIGGASLHRLKGEESEVIGSFFFSRNIFWYGEPFKKMRGHDAELPYDNHFLHAMVAPRLLLVTDAFEDHGANPPGTYAACCDAKRVFQMLGRPEAIGWVIREEGHSHKVQDYISLLDFMDLHFHQRDPMRCFQRRLYPNLTELLKPAREAIPAPAQ